MISREHELEHQFVTEKDESKRLDIAVALAAERARMITTLRQQIEEANAKISEFIWAEGNPGEYESELAKTKQQLADSQAEVEKYRGYWESLAHRCRHSPFSWARFVRAECERERERADSLQAKLDFANTLLALNKICQSCGDPLEESQCMNIDCSEYWKNE